MLPLLLLLLVLKNAFKGWKEQVQESEEEERWGEMGRRRETSELEGCSLFLLLGGGRQFG